MKKKNQPESFSFPMLTGDTLVYNGKSTITPNCTCLVEGNPTELDAQVVQKWFLNNIVPLVGRKAADHLQSLFAAFSQHEHVKGFHAEALLYRQGLK
jgi:hypothetical protein